MRKLSVSVPADVLAAAEKAVAEGQAPSLSAYVTDALRTRAIEQKKGGLRALLDEWDRELGPPSQAAVEWADQVLSRTR